MGLPLLKENSVREVSGIFMDDEFYKIKNLSNLEHCFKDKNFISNDKNKSFLSGFGYQESLEGSI
jgi:hypothetical protein